MAAQTLNDILNRTQEFHNGLAKSLEESVDEIENERAQLLLDYLREHEQKLAHALHVMQDSADLKQLNTWFYEYTQKHNVIRAKQEHKPFSQMNSREIMAEVMDEHDQIIELYRYLYGRAGTSPAQELLQELIQLEQSETMLMAQEGNRAEDM